MLTSASRKAQTFLVMFWMFGIAVGIIAAAAMLWTLVCSQLKIPKRATKLWNNSKEKRAMKKREAEARRRRLEGLDVELQNMQR